MKKKLSVLTVALASVFFACSNGDNQNSNTNQNTDTSHPATTTTSENNTGESTDPKGIGKYTHVELTTPLDQEKVKIGDQIYNVKCASCHKLTDERLVGPGWKNVTKRRTPEWIMNFVTNTEEMIQRDTTAKSLLETCLVQMPNQNLQESEAFSVLEFMRNNDGEK